MSRMVSNNWPELVIPPARYCRVLLILNQQFSMTLISGDWAGHTHRARIVERYKHDNNIHGMVWPAQSPDINVIENCWLRIKRTLQYRAGGITNSGQS
jgi:hypothetical protein